MKSDLSCPFCNSKEFIEYNSEHIKKINKEKSLRQFFRCNSCEGVFVNTACFLSIEKQRERYLCHRNSLADIGYRNFVQNFADTVLLYWRRSIKESADPASIYDYGCGYEPALSQLLKEYTQNGKLSPSVQIRSWDPLFAPDTDFFPLGADLVLCLEVIEHFEDPAAGFAGFSRACRKDGIIALQTMLVPKTQQEFNAWWYKDDSTHVCFYSAQALRICAERAGLNFCGAAKTGKNSVFILKKTD